MHDRAVADTTPPRLDAASLLRHPAARADRSDAAGLLAGPSGGAAVVAALREARATGARTAVVVLPDGGERYLSDRVWESP